MKGKKAVILFNLGGPDAISSVEPFLFNLFSDPDIFRLPLGFLLQKPFARLLSRRRAPTAAIGYRALGGASPLLENTRRQAVALAAALEPQHIDVHICMRYWHPMSDEAVAALKRTGYDELILLPLYPQYSRTTTGSSYNDFQRACTRQSYHPAIHLIEHWYERPDYHAAIAASIKAQLQHFPAADPTKITLLFSAHGLPQKIVDAGDPYEKHIRATYDAVCAQLNWPQTRLCYQSRVGPLPWLKPYTEDVIREEAKKGAQQILVYPIAFVSDHIETLYELGQEYAALAQQLGVAHYRVVPALNDDPALIACLRNLILEQAN